MRLADLSAGRTFIGSRTCPDYNWCRKILTKNTSYTAQKGVRWMNWQERIRYLWVDPDDMD